MGRVSTELLPTGNNEVVLPAVFSAAALPSESADGVVSVLPGVLPAESVEGDKWTVASLLASL